MPVDPALDLLHKRMASELEALRELVKKAELISRGPACKGGAAPAGRRKRILAAEPRPRKMSPPLHQNQKQRHIEVPRMSPDEREQLAGRLASLAAVPGHIVEFLQQQFGGGADPEGEIEIDVLKVEDSVLFELKTRLDKFAEESLIADAGFLPKEEHGSVTMEVIRSDAIPEQDEEDVDICGASDSDSDSSSSSSSDSDGSSSGSDSDEVVSGRAPPAVLLPEENGTSAQPPPDPAPEASQSTDPESVPDDGAGSTAPPALLPEVVSPAQPPSHPASEVARIAEQTKVRGVQRAAPRAVCLAGAIYRAKVRRELMEMERAVQPNESIHPEVLQRLCIAEYGRPGIMRQLGLFLKADA
ncbi:hypothetical protein PVAP13_1NG340219 [Panicum virgatum]|uniref:NET domain-containing protein n=1 Tax=Panicum virgatum TaxID=38727 RepID=A0A8T0WST1_PANVG|nr:hypothetical protein PVAP13_1NG340219 [Panicum virgatum]